MNIVTAGDRKLLYHVNIKYGKQMNVKYVCGRKSKNIKSKNIEYQKNTYAYPVSLFIMT